MGEAIEAWQALRPVQPQLVDRSEKVDFLFTFRARRVPSTYINGTVIPLLCRKAGVPPADVRGNITSHRARSTIASQLYNAKEPMAATNELVQAVSRWLDASPQNQARDPDALLWGRVAKVAPRGSGRPARRRRYGATRCSNLTGVLPPGQDAPLLTPVPRLYT
jgi:hypothetical protein